MIVCIFSFNRGRFLQHCVDSVERCAPHWDICVIDDDSNDPGTRDTLNQIAKTHRVLNAGEIPGRKHGGLYGNMQNALETFKDRELLLCLQDDMQLVRSITPEDEQFVQNHFANNPDAAFIQPCFLKGSNRERDQKTLQFCEQRKIYVRENKGQSAGLHYSDIHITSPSRLLAAGWQFADSEPDNDRQAARHFGKLAHLYAPFAMWLPEVPAYRGKRKTLALKLAERRRHCDLYPFQYLSDAQAQALRERPTSVLPVAEDFLDNVEPNLEKPWVYYPLQGSRWLKKLNSLELAVRRMKALSSP